MGTLLEHRKEDFSLFKGSDDEHKVKISPQLLLATQRFLSRGESGQGARRPSLPVPRGKAQGHLQADRWQERALGSPWPASPADCCQSDPVTHSAVRPLGLGQGEQLGPVPQTPCRGAACPWSRRLRLGSLPLAPHQRWICSARPASPRRSCCTS